LKFPEGEAGWEKVGCFQDGKYPVAVVNRKIMTYKGKMRVEA
jgi:hypothetical protein